MAAYSIGLRQKMLRAYEYQLSSQRAWADLSGVSPSCAKKILRCSRATGGVRRTGGRAWTRLPHPGLAADACDWFMHCGYALQ